MESVLDKWWASRTIAEKERIASKVEGRDVHYPECTDVWNHLDCEAQLVIYEHCVDAHKQKMRAWHRGNPMT